MPVHASFYVFAFWFFIIFPLMILAFAEFFAAMDRRRRRLRREGWRDHRAHMDSLEPKRWNW